MYLLPNLAKRIIKEVAQVISEDIIVVDTKGIIIASTKKERIGSFHEGAKRALQTKQKLYIDKKLSEELIGVKAGINMPIMFGTRVIGVIGVTGDPLQVEPFAELIRRMTELLIQESYYSEQIEWKTRGLESYFYEWVNKREVDTDFISRGALLQIPVENSHVCCLLQLKKFPKNDNDMRWIELEIMELFHQTFSHHGDYLIRFGQGLYFILKDCSEDMKTSRLSFQLEQFQKNIKKKYKTASQVGVGKTICTNDIHQSYIEAKRALKVAMKKDGIVYYEDLIIDVIIEEIPEDLKNEYIEKTIEPLVSQKELIETLHEYIKNNQSIKETSLSMHLHINTLHYRLKQIKEITGIDPKETEGMVLLYLALLFFEDLTNMNR